METTAKRSYQKWTKEQEDFLYSAARKTGSNWYLIQTQWLPQFTEFQIRHKYYQLKAKRAAIKRERENMEKTDTSKLITALLNMI